jgi:hypothetical protein
MAGIIIRVNHGKKAGKIMVSIIVVPGSAIAIPVSMQSWDIIISIKIMQTNINIKPFKHWRKSHEK